jgi:hypothetical protein
MSGSAPCLSGDHRVAFERGLRASPHWGSPGGMFSLPTRDIAVGICRRQGGEPHACVSTMNEDH